MERKSGQQSVSETEAFATLSEYLELALDKGSNLVMVRNQDGTSTLYVGDVGLSEEDLKKCGVVQNALADAILEATEFGFNELSINGFAFRFMRAFTQVGSRGAVVFALV